MFFPIVSNALFFLLNQFVTNLTEMITFAEKICNQTRILFLYFCIILSGTYGIYNYTKNEKPVSNQSILYSFMVVNKVAPIVFMCI